MTQTATGLLPRVLIVRSEHFAPAKTKQEMEQLLADVDKVAYVRNLVIWQATYTYDPVNVYVDGVVQEMCDGFYNPYLDMLVKGFSEKTGGDPDRIIGVPHLEWFKSKILPQDQYSNLRQFYAQLADKDPIFARLAAEKEAGFIDMGSYDVDRLTMMLSTAKAQGAKITMCPAEQSVDLLLERIEAQETRDAAKIKLTNSLVDANLYARVLEDTHKTGRNGIVYLGSGHRLEPFMTTPLLSVDWIDVQSVPSGKIEVRGTLPYIKGQHDPASLKKDVTEWLQSGPLEIAVGIEMKPVRAA